MKTNIILLFILLASSNLMFSQVPQGSFDENNTYPPKSYGDLTPKESWEIHKAAYIKQLKTKGLTDLEFKKSLSDYKKQKEEFLAKVEQRHRIAAIEREKAAERRALAAIERKKAEEKRRLAAIQREKADELRKLAGIERKKADEQREKDAEQRAKDAEKRAKDAVQRAADAEQRAKDAIKRVKAEEQRKKAQEWINNAENILIKNITLSNQSNSSKPIVFKVTTKTTLRIGIRAHISSGTTLIEIYNPDGIKEGELSLEFKSKPVSSASNDFLNKTSGALDKTILDAEVGEWQIKISSQKSEGTVAMSVAQYIKPPMDE